MRLWVDDIRDPAHYHAVGFTWATSVEAAMDLLSLGNITFASLDHDIGEKSGLDLVLWMRDRDIWPVDGVRVHSATVMCGPDGVNGRDAMNAIIDTHYPEALTSFYKADRNENGAYFPGMPPAKRTCKYGDPLCPCQDGDQCHYEGVDPFPAPTPRSA